MKSNTMSSLQNPSSDPDNSKLNEVAGRLPKLMLLVVLVVSAVVAIFAVGAYLLGKKANEVGYSPDTSIRQIVVGNDVVNIPANVIRFFEQRRASAIDRLDLFYHWPSFEGYSEARKADFLAQIGPVDNLIFASLEKRKLERDIGGRFRTIYSRLLEGMAAQSAPGLVFQNMAPEAGYSGEELHYEKRNDSRYVVRCQREEENVFATCLRDVHIGKSLSLTYRFSRKLLPQWRALEEAMRNITARYLAE